MLLAFDENDFSADDGIVCFDFAKPFSDRKAILIIFAKWSSARVKINSVRECLGNCEDLIR